MIQSAWLALGYAVAAWLSLCISRQAGSVAAIWFANALGVAALCHWPRAHWPGLCAWLALALFAVNTLWGDAPWMAVSFVPGNLVEMCLGAWALQRVRLPQRGLGNAGDMLQLLLLAGVLPQLVGASLGALTMAWHGLAPVSQVWLPWFEGSVIGAVSALPLAMRWHEQGGRALWLSCCQAWMGVLLPFSVGLTVVALLTMPYPFVYLTLPLLLAATRLDLGAVAVLTLAVSLTVATTLAVGLWAPPPMRAAWQQIFVYMAYAAALLPAQLLAATVSGLRASQAQLMANSLKLRQANEGLEQFVRIASHDLREPLNTVMQFAALLQSDEAERLSPPGRRYLDFVQQGGQRMRGLLDDMLQFVQTQHGAAGALGPVPLQPLLEELLQVLAHRIEAQQATVTVGALPVVRGQALTLSLLFQNLLANALKFVAPGQRPRVSVQAEPVPGTGGAQVRIAVYDQGIGIAEQDLPRLFQPFSRLQVRRLYEGSGLGLALAQQIAQQHGTEIRVESVVGQGSCFSLVLAVSPPPPAELLTLPQRPSISTPHDPSKTPPDRPA